MFCEKEPGRKESIPTLYSPDGLHYCWSFEKNPSKTIRDAISNQDDHFISDADAQMSHQCEMETSVF